MVQGKNKGHRYEYKIVDILKKKQIPMTQGPAGSGVGADMEILYNNKKITFEMKNNVRDPDYGQCVIWSTENEDGSYSWDWNDESKRKNPKSRSQFRESHVFRVRTHPNRDQTLCSK